MNIYDNIANLAKQRSMSIAEVERRAGLSNGVIDDWKTAAPRITSLIAVATVFDVNVDTLVAE